MNRVILESPYAGNVDLNTRYARLCVKDSLSKGEAPLASHLLYTQMLDDDEEREWGINAGLEWLKGAEYTVVYTDLGVSDGMKRGIEAAYAAGLPVEWRRLGCSGCFMSKLSDLG